jgi:Peptidase family M28/PDZ domain/PA domain
MNMTRFITLFAFLLILPLTTLGDIPEMTWDAEARLLMHVAYLANDAREGRGIGTDGLEASADYIEHYLEEAGVQPLFDGSFSQPFTIGWGAEILANTYLSVGEDTLRYSASFRPAGFSTASQMVKPAVFAGYGISADEYEYDDYADIDVTDKLVIVFTGEPRRDDPDALFAGDYDTDHASLRTKATNAKMHGAAGMLIVPSPADADTLPTLRTQEPYRDAGIPVAFVTAEAAGRLLPRLALNKLYRSIELNQSPRAIPLGDDLVTLSVDLHRNELPVRNVGGIIPGDDRLLIFGAHYDHLGYGQSGSRIPGVRAIHNGADDNASGVSVMLEVARLLSQSPPGPTVAFVAFTGEEVGLVGSSHFVGNSPLDLDRSELMVNFDMVGRMQNDNLTVFGVESAEGLTELAQQAGVDSPLNLAMTGGGYGASDQTSFYSKGIPVLHLLTSLHGDYHRPEDDIAEINGAGMVKVLQYTLSLAETFADADIELAYQAAEEPNAEGRASKRRVSMGTIPDFAQPDSLVGFRLQGVRPGSPADDAGLQAMDIIVAIGDILIDNIYDLTYAMGKHEPGDEVTIRYRRGEDEFETRLTFAEAVARGHGGG